MSPSAQSPFCDTCQRNQTIVNKAMAEYIPDEDDPDYDRHVATANAYRAELETRYPQVCEKCIGQVHDRIRTAAYAAKVDNLRRTLEDSTKRKLLYNTPRQIWSLRGIRVAKWVYMISTSVEILFHASCMAGALDSADTSPTSAFCLPRTLLDLIGQHRNHICLSPELSQKLLWWALMGDMFTLWWNPRLKQMVTRPGRRMRGLIPLWLARIFTHGLRSAGIYWGHTLSTENQTSQLLFAHGAIFLWIITSVIISLKAVRIEYLPTKSLTQPIDAHLPNVPSRAASEEQEYRPIRPKADIYDSMAQSFTSSFGAPNDAQPSANLPPSPTLTATTISAIDSESQTPYVPKTTRISESDMDWTPTRNRFSRYPVGIQPPIWGSTQSEEEQKPQPKPKHSLFTQPDPNPFRHKVPAFPKPPAHEKRDPWKSKLWAPAAEEMKKTFLTEVMQTGKADEERRRRLVQEGVPRVVQRDEELFQKPRFKYDYQGYVGEKTTGLEEGFNKLWG